MIDVTDSWAKIEDFIETFQTIERYNVIWSEINQKPISLDFINKIRTNGHRVEYQSFPEHHFGEYDRRSKLILLNEALQECPYERDVTLFHELAHARHPFSLNDNRWLKYEERQQREIVAEWLGRKARANPELLRHTIVSFGLEPRVYDLASYYAFQDLKITSDFKATF